MRQLEFEGIGPCVCGMKGCRMNISTAFSAENPSSLLLFFAQAFLSQHNLNPLIKKERKKKELKHTKWGVVYRLSRNREKLRKVPNQPVICSWLRAQMRVSEIQRKLGVNVA